MRQRAEGAGRTRALWQKEHRLGAQAKLAGCPLCPVLREAGTRPHSGSLSLAPPPGRRPERRGAPREGAAAPQGELRELPQVRGGRPWAGSGKAGRGGGAGALRTCARPCRKRALRKMQHGSRQGEVDWENTTGSDNTDTEGS